MKFTDIFIRRPIMAIALSLLLVVFGLQAVTKLGVREYPKMTVTVVTVTTSYPGANAGLIQSFVTSKLEESIAQANDIDYMTSSSVQGTSVITVKMKLDTNPNSALSDIMSKVNAVRSSLPSAIEDPVVSASSGSSGQIYIGYTSDSLTTPQIVDYINRIVKPQLFTVNGVAKADVYGSSFAMRIWLDPAKLASLKLSIPQVMSALSSNNVQTAAGNSNGWYTIFKNKVNSTTTSVEQLKNLVISNHNGRLVHLGDIAKVNMDNSSDAIRSIANGKRAVVVAVDTTSEANPLTVVQNLYPVLNRIKRDLPPSIQTEVLYDRTIAINSSIDEVVKTIIEATLIVLVVIMLFLGSLRSMIVPIVTIPLSLIGALMLLQVAGASINLMTLLAMILAIGLVVDDAIVVLENVDRHIKLGETPFRAAIIGTREIAMPVIAMTISLCAVYTPMAMMGGITGALIKEFALTLAGAVFISGFVALTLSPMMCSKMLKPHTNPSKFEACVSTFLDKLTAGYTAILHTVLRMRAIVLGFAVLVFCSLPVFLSSLSSELLPAEDMGAFMSIGNTTANKNVDYISDSMEQYSKILAKTPEVHYQQILSGIPSSNMAIAITTLKDWNERKRSQAEIMKSLNGQAHAIPEMSISAFPFPLINTGEQGMPVSFVITTPDDIRSLAQVAGSVLEAAKKSGKVAFSNLDLKFDTAEMTMNIDKDMANSYGIQMNQISSMLSSYLSGANFTYVDLDGRSYPIISGITRDKRLNPSSMDNFYLTAADGRSVPLSSIVKLTLNTQPLSLNRFNQLNSATISGVPIGSMSEAVNWFKDDATKLLPKGYGYDFRGESRQYIQEGGALYLTFGLAVLVIFLVLAIQFESVRDSIVILVSVPLALSGALLVLNIFGFLGTPGATLNVYSEVGLITLVGLITKHGILMCEVAKEEQIKHGKNRIDAIETAARIRLRPILMTTAAMIAGLIPLLFAVGAGAVSRFSIGIVIVAGLAIGTLFTLFVLPVIYSFIASKHKPLEVFDESIPAIQDERD